MLIYLILLLWQALLNMKEGLTKIPQVSLFFSIHSESPPHILQEHICYRNFFWKEGRRGWSLQRTDHKIAHCVYQQKCKLSPTILRLGNAIFLNVMVCNGLWRGCPSKHSQWGESNGRCWNMRSLNLMIGCRNEMNVSEAHTRILMNGMSEERFPFGL